MGDQPRISVIIATYRPGDGFDRVIASLDAQTLPQGEFETVVVDDGSPDDTVVRLTRLAATRPNLRVTGIPGSGWPSRPRNVGVDLARGEWVLFMDHDDSLYPDALRRLAEYAAETRADVVSPKESKTSDVWWGMPALEHGNVPDAKAAGGIEALLPMVPHKLYRRAFLQEHGIRFPEGRRMLWEDIHLNVAAWRAAERVAVLADTPVYLWHSSATNSSKSYGPRDVEYWDRLDELLAAIDRTLAGPAFEDDRRSALLHQYRGRVLDRFSRMLGTASQGEVRMGIARARAIQEAYVPAAWDAHLGRFERARSLLLRAERADLMEALASADAGVRARASTRSLQWRDGRLEVVLEAGWTGPDGDPLPLRLEGGRALRDLPGPLLDALPADVLDLTDETRGMTAALGLRSRSDHVTWEVPLDQSAELVPVGGDAVTPLVRGTAVVDPAAAVFGAPLPEGVWDVHVATRWEGLVRGAALGHRGRPLPALASGRAAVAYSNRRRELTLDTEGRLENVANDAHAAEADIPGSADGLAITPPEE